MNDFLNNAKIIYDFMSESEPLPGQADFILAAGCRDLRVADHAAGLWLKGYAPLLVLSGGLGKATLGVFSKPEAEMFADRCRTLGVPDRAMIIENRSANTGENFTFSRQLLKNKNVKTGIIACKPYMVKRAWATGAKQWPEIDWYASGIPLSFEQYPTEDVTAEETIRLMLGDLQRLWVYEAKGYQAHVDVPQEVLDAYHSMTEKGFDRYIIAGEEK